MEYIDIIYYFTFNLNKQLYSGNRVKNTLGNRELTRGVPL